MEEAIIATFDDIGGLQSDGIRRQIYNFVEKKRERKNYAQNGFFKTSSRAGRRQGDF